MEFLTTLWLPILLAAFFVFGVSSVLHMVLSLHKSDYRKLPNEASLLNEMRNGGLTPGSYMFPGVDSKEDCTPPEMAEKYAKGPVGQILIRANNSCNMGLSLIQWFVLSIVISLLTAYLAWITLGAGADSSILFRVVFTTAWMAYGFGSIQESIWKGNSWKSTSVYLFDAALYALATASTFQQFWPPNLLG
ncbi:MAG: hypothetical protein HOM34_06140 [Planctomycetes bacterium]|jgi:hypothetical protein|nr:hypothetical protein [Planctomycetota bacterium]MBT4028467.1 hypothetical protein [Planctomycetota bacterium]MBT4560859.1 hypothetical protein [Planctomycetota bacterium]MBT5101825.1 hypothetical protein [Planctomycetota bacterium]MBT5120284.1 hypothetical protein [Planctomycetota bacterium]